MLHVFVTIYKLTYVPCDSTSPPSACPVSLMFFIPHAVLLQCVACGAKQRHRRSSVGEHMWGYGPGGVRVCVRVRMYVCAYVCVRVCVCRVHVCMCVVSILGRVFIKHTAQTHTHRQKDSYAHTENEA